MWSAERELGGGKQEIKQTKGKTFQKKKEAS